MAQQTVTLVEAEKKEGSNAKGGWFFWTFKDAGGNRWQTAFGNGLGYELAGSLNQSVTLTYHEELRNNFTNNVIDGAEFHGAGTSPTQAVNAPQSAPSDKDASIARAVAFKGAIELAANGVLDPDPDGIVAVAQHFTGYLLTGKVAETADTRL